MTTISDPLVVPPCGFFGDRDVFRQLCVEVPAKMEKTVGNQANLSPPRH